MGLRLKTVKRERGAYKDILPYPSKRVLAVNCPYNSRYYAKRTNGQSQI